MNIDNDKLRMAKIKKDRGMIRGEMINASSIDAQSDEMDLDITPLLVLQDDRMKNINISVGVTNNVGATNLTSDIYALARKWEGDL